MTFVSVMFLQEMASSAKNVSLQQVGTNVTRTGTRQLVSLVTIAVSREITGKQAGKDFKEFGKTCMMKQACDKPDVVCMLYGTSFQLTDYKCKSECCSTDLCNQEAEKNGAKFQMVSAIMVLASALVAFIR